MCEFVAIGLETERIEEEGTEAAIAFAQQGRGVIVPRLERAQMLPEHGAGYEVREGDRSQGEEYGWTEERGGTRGRVCE